MSVVERARIVRVPNEAQLERALLALLEAPSVRGSIGRGGTGGGMRRASRLRIARRASRPEPPASVPAGTPGGVAAERPAEEGGAAAAVSNT